MKKTYSISAYTENKIGVLNRLSAIFLKRHINIESFSSSESEIENVFRFIIVVVETESQIKKLIGQIEKQIDVIKAFYHTQDELIYQSSALYKIQTDILFEKRNIHTIIKKYNANIIYASKDLCVIEKTSRSQEINALHKELTPYGIMQFVRSGQISVSKKEMNITNILKKFK